MIENEEIIEEDVAQVGEGKAPTSGEDEVLKAKKDLYRALISSPDYGHVFKKHSFESFNNIITNDKEGLKQAINIGVEIGAISDPAKFSTFISGQKVTDIARYSMMPTAEKAKPKAPVQEPAKAPEKKDESSFLEDIWKSIERGWTRGEAIQVAKPSDIFQGKVSDEDLKKIAALNAKIKLYGQTGIEKDFQKQEGLLDTVTDWLKMLPAAGLESYAALIRSGYNEALAGMGIGAGAGALGMGIGAIPMAAMGFGAGLTTAGSFLEFYSSIMESFEDAGYDTSDWKQLKAAQNNPDVLEKARKRAGTRAAVIGIGSAVGAGALSNAKLGKLAIPVDMATEVGIELGAQAAAGDKLNLEDALLETSGQILTPVRYLLSKVPKPQYSVPKNKVETPPSTLGGVAMEDGERVAISPDEAEEFKNTGVVPEEIKISIIADVKDGIDILADPDIDPLYKQMYQAMRDSGELEAELESEVVAGDALEATVNNVINEAAKMGIEMDEGDGLSVVEYMNDKGVSIVEAIEAVAQAKAEEGDTESKTQTEPAASTTSTTESQIEAKKAEIERRRKKDPSLERGVLINFESEKTKEQLANIVNRLNNGTITLAEILDEFSKLPLNTLNEVKEAFRNGTLADKIQFGLDVSEINDLKPKTRSKESIIKAKQKAELDKQKAEEALKNSEYRIVKKRNSITGQVTETKVKRTDEEKAKYEDFHKKALEEANKNIEEYDAELKALEEQQSKLSTESKTTEKAPSSQSETKGTKKAIEAGAKPKAEANDTGVTNVISEPTVQGKTIAEEAVEEVGIQATKEQPKPVKTPAQKPAAKGNEKVLTKEEAEPTKKENEAWDKDVESTAKALENSDSENIAIPFKGKFSDGKEYDVTLSKKQSYKDFSGNEIKGFKGLANSTIPYKLVAEAYHADKKAGKETELTKAVEKLLGKPTETKPQSAPVSEAKTDGGKKPVTKPKAEAKPEGTQETFEKSVDEAIKGTEITQEQGDALKKTKLEQAKAWAKRTGKTVADFFAKFKPTFRKAKSVKGLPQGALFQNEGYLSKSDFNPDGTVKESVLQEIKEERDIIEKIGKAKTFEEFKEMMADFRDGHSAPSKDTRPAEEKLEEGGDFSLREVAQGVHSQPDDYFDPKVGAIYYGYDNKEGMQSYVAINNVVRALKAGKKDVKVKVYRAVPQDIPIDRLIDYDWVSFSKEYAINHGERRFGEGEYKIIEQEVGIDDLWWDGNDINEWGYDTGGTKWYSNAELKEMYENSPYKGKFGKAPNGKKSNLTDEQWITVRTRRFKQWFGDWENDPQNASKVVDENGEPLVVYHGTKADFDVFKSGETKGSPYSDYFDDEFFFTDNYEVAKAYGTETEYDKEKKQKIKKGAEIFKNTSYYKENQKEIYGQSDEYYYKKLITRYDNKLFKKDDLEYISKYIDSIRLKNKETVRVIEAFLNIRHPYNQKGENVGITNKVVYEEDYTDGNIITNADTGAGVANEYIVFSPNQIKSATSNIGTFSEGNPSILFQQQQQTPLGAFTTIDGAQSAWLFDGAKPETLFHEDAHGIKGIIEDIADNALPEYKEQAVADEKTIQEFVGAKDRNWTREQHEKLANAFVKYLNEGKAPTNALAEVFERIKQWLAGVWVNAREMDEIQLTPEVRAVFDRLLGGNIKPQAKAQSKATALESGTEIETLAKGADITQDEARAVLMMFGGSENKGFKKAFKAFMKVPISEIEDYLSEAEAKLAPKLIAYRKQAANKPKSISKKVAETIEKAVSEQPEENRQAYESERDKSKTFEQALKDDVTAFIENGVDAIKNYSKKAIEFITNVAAQVKTLLLAAGVGLTLVALGINGTIDADVIQGIMFIPAFKVLKAPIRRKIQTVVDQSINAGDSSIQTVNKAERELGSPLNAEQVAAIKLYYDKAKRAVPISTQDIANLIGVSNYNKLSNMAAKAAAAGKSAKEIYTEALVKLNNLKVYPSIAKQMALKVAAMATSNRNPNAKNIAQNLKTNQLPAKSRAMYFTDQVKAALKGNKISKANAVKIMTMYKGLVGSTRGLVNALDALQRIMIDSDYLNKLADAKRAYNALKSFNSSKLTYADKQLIQHMPDIYVSAVSDLAKFSNTLTDWMLGKQTGKETVSNAQLEAYMQQMAIETQAVKAAKELRVLEMREEEFQKNLANGNVPPGITTLDQYKNYLQGNPQYLTYQKLNAANKLPAGVTDFDSYVEYKRQEQYDSLKQKGQLPLGVDTYAEYVAYIEGDSDVKHDAQVKGLKEAIDNNAHLSKSIANLKNIDLKYLMPDEVYRVINAINNFLSTGQITDIDGIYAKALARQNMAKLPKVTERIPFIKKMTVNALSRLLGYKSDPANIKRILTGGIDTKIDNNTNQMLRAANAIRDYLNKNKIKDADIVVGNIYGFFAEVSEPFVEKQKSLVDTINYVRRRYEAAINKDSHDSVTWFNHVFQHGVIINAIIDVTESAKAAEKLGLVTATYDSRGYVKSVAAVDGVDMSTLDSKIDAKAKLYYDYTQDILDIYNADFFNEVKKFTNEPLSPIQKYFGRSWIRMDTKVESENFLGSMDNMFSSSDPTKGKLSRSLVDRMRGRVGLGKDGGYYQFNGINTFLDSVFMMQSYINLLPEYTYLQEVVNSKHGIASVFQDARTASAIKEMLASRVGARLDMYNTGVTNRSKSNAVLNFLSTNLVKSVLNRPAQIGKQVTSVMFVAFTASPKVTAKALYIIRQVALAKMLPMVGLPVPKRTKEIMGWFKELRMESTLINRLKPDELEAAAQYKRIKDLASGSTFNTVMDFLEVGRETFNKYTLANVMYPTDNFISSYAKLVGYIDYIEKQTGMPFNFKTKYDSELHQNALQNAEIYMETANSVNTPQDLPIEIKDAKKTAVGRMQYFLSTMTFVTTMQSFVSVKVLFKPGSSPAMKSWAIRNILGTIAGNMAFEMVARAAWPMLKELMWKDDPEDDETKEQNLYDNMYRGVANSTVNLATAIFPIYVNMITKTALGIVEITAKSQLLDEDDNDPAQWDTVKKSIWKEKNKNLFFEEQIPGIYSIALDLFKLSALVYTNMTGKKPLSDEYVFLKGGTSIIASFMGLGTAKEISNDLYKQSIKEAALAEKTSKKVFEQHPKVLIEWRKSLIDRGLSNQEVSDLVFIEEQSRRPNMDARRTLVDVYLPTPEMAEVFAKEYRLRFEEAKQLLMTYDPKASPEKMYRYAGYLRDIGKAYTQKELVSEAKRVAKDAANEAMIKFYQAEIAKNPNFAKSMKVVTILE
jgi:hypothetical protein